MPEHDYPFDPTHGYDEAALLRVPAPTGPADFDAFWRRTFQEAMAPPLNLAVRPVDSPRGEVEVFEVEYDSLDGLRIGGWFTRPVNGPVERGVVLGHGYGGREAPELNLPGPPAATIQFCARGFHRSVQPGWPANNSSRHVLWGIEARETYSHRGCVADVWRAASALLEWMPELEGRLHYEGGSFGGGIGALALPWDTRFSAAYLRVPSFGNYPLRVTLPCTGSGHWVSRYYQRRPQVLDVLAYFDAATAARRIRIPVLVQAARFDPAVPPPSQCSVYNGLAGSKRIFFRHTGHFDDLVNGPRDDAVANEELAAFARAQLDGRGAAADAAVTTPAR